MNRKLLSAVSRLLVATLVGLSLPLQPAQAGMIGTEAAIAGQASAARVKLQAFLERAEVQAQLERLGVHPSEAQSRVDALTEEEIAQLASKIDQLPAGGTDILGVVLVIFIILLITDILGLTKIFPFTRSMR